jgi:molybdopterin molybdotransferase
MISVVEARRLIAAAMPPPSIGIAPLNATAAVVLREPLTSDRSLPPFDRVAMDGVAIKSAAFYSGQRQFLVEACQSAGQPPLRLGNPTHAIEIMTGAVLPEGCDAVVRYEDLQFVSAESAKFAIISNDLLVEPFLNVHRMGSDCTTGTMLAKSGSTMNAPLWGIAAAIGATAIQASRLPSVGILATGDELVDVSEQPLPHQIRASNSHAVAAALRRFGIHEITLEFAKDDVRSLMQQLDSLLSHRDVVITLGGVSKGKFDYLPGVLSDLKVSKVFHEVRQRPGKPLWFGVAADGKPVFGLPGNPVSVLVNLYAHILPAIHFSLGATADKAIYARLTDRVTFDKPMTFFQPCRFEGKADGCNWVTPVRGNGSGDFASLAPTDGFVELPEGGSPFASGQAFRFFDWSRP